jgi:hypothetical protein
MIRTIAPWTLALAIACAGDDDGPPRTDGGVDAGTEPADAGPGCVEPNGRCETAGSDECCGDLVCRASSSGAAFCVAADDLCFIGADPGCCLDEADCADGERCHYAIECRLGADGVCKPIPGDPTECWSDRDCGAMMRCDGAVVCECGASCLVEDSPGTCVAM